MHNMYRVEVIWEQVTHTLVRLCSHPQASVRQYGVDCLTQLLTAALLSLQPPSSELSHLSLGPAAPRISQNVSSRTKGPELKERTETLVIRAEPPTPEVKPRRLSTSREFLSKADLDELQFKLLVPVQELYRCQHLDVRENMLQGLHQVLRSAGHVLTSGWVAIAGLLQAAAAQEEAPLVPIAFKSLQIIASDFLHGLPPDCLSLLISTIGAYGSQRCDINIALTAVNMLFTVADFLRKDRSQLVAAYEKTGVERLPFAPLFSSNPSAFITSTPRGTPLHSPPKPPASSEAFVLPRSSSSAGAHGSLALSAAPPAAPGAGLVTSISCDSISARLRSPEPPERSFMFPRDVSSSSVATDQEIAAASAQFQLSVQDDADTFVPPREPPLPLSPTHPPLDALWLSLYSQAHRLSSDPRPEVRNCALRTLSSTLVTHGGVLGPSAWYMCMWHILFPAFQAVRQAAFDSSRSSAANDDSVGTPQLGKEKGAPVMMLLHHSRNTIRKQWDETVVLALNALSRVFRTFFNGPLGLLPHVQYAWHRLVRYAKEAVLSSSRETSLAGIHALEDLLQALNSVGRESEVFSYALWERVWVAYEQVVETLAGLRACPINDMDGLVSSSPLPADRSSPAPSSMVISTTITIDSKVLNVLLEGVADIYARARQLFRPRDIRGVLRFHDLLIRAVSSPSLHKKRPGSVFLDVHGTQVHSNALSNMQKMPPFEDDLWLYVYGLVIGYLPNGSEAATRLIGLSVHAAAAAEEAEAIQSTARNSPTTPTPCVSQGSRPPHLPSHTHTRTASGSAPAPAPSGLTPPSPPPPPSSPVIDLTLPLHPYLPLLPASFPPPFAEKALLVLIHFSQKGDAPPGVLVKVFRPLIKVLSSCMMAKYTSAPASASMSNSGAISAGSSSSSLWRFSVRALMSVIRVGLIAVVRDMASLSSDDEDKLALWNDLTVIFGSFLLPESPLRVPFGTGGAGGGAGAGAGQDSVLEDEDLDVGMVDCLALDVLPLAGTHASPTIRWDLVSLLVEGTTVLANASSSSLFPPLVSLPPVHAAFLGPAPIVFPSGLTPPLSLPSTPKRSLTMMIPSASLPLPSLLPPAMTRSRSLSPASDALPSLLMAPSPSPGQTSTSSSLEEASSASWVIDRERFARACWHRLVGLCSSQPLPSPSQEIPVPAGKASMETVRLVLARLAAPVLLDRCRDLVRRYVSDERRAGQAPLPRYRYDEVAFVLREMQELDLCSGVLDAEGQPFEMHTMHRSPSWSLRLSQAQSGWVPPTAVHGKKAHLLVLYPSLCDCIVTRDDSIREVIREILHEIGRLVGLEPQVDVAKPLSQNGFSTPPAT
mmetsp:Transcript_5623/g.8694  ORF Transcript_5623/g.8694 Transcript_5623/m.8694 type:complete len:1334 (+) Transcript_5623:1-4002(+)